MSLSETAFTSMPAISMVPPLGRTSRNAVLPTVVLPDPLSPTRPTVSPAQRVRDSLSTARTTCPLCSGKWTSRSRIASIAGSCSAMGELLLAHFIIERAGHVMRLGDGAHRHGGRADLCAVGAARREQAALRRGQKVGQRAGNRGQVVLGPQWM